MKNPTDMVPGILCGLGIIFVAISLALQIGFEDSWIIYGKGIGFVLLLAIGAICVIALAIWSVS